MDSKIFDICLESVNTLAIGLILWSLRRACKRNELRRQSGWRWIVAGYFLLFVGSLFDLSDNFSSLNRLVIFGSTPAEAFMEKVVGYLGGFSCIFVGFVRWLPTVCQLHEARQLLETTNRELHTEVARRCEAEEELRRLNSDLEERVRERTAQLEASNQELTAFSYSVSHDLRAPLARIIGYNRLLLEELPEQSPPDNREYLERIERAGEEMVRLIDDLLSLGNVTNKELRLANVDLSRLAEEIMAELRLSDTGRRVEIAIQPKITVEGDAGLLRVALKNLLQNAWKYSARREVARVEVSATATPAGVTCLVRDNGVGFAMEQSHRLFKAFQRLHSPAEFSGTGIGLATVARIIQRHGGIVRAEGVPDAGATFSFFLPNRSGQSLSVCSPTDVHRLPSTVCPPPTTPITPA